MSDGQPTPAGLRLQIALAVSTGVLVIATTTAVAVIASTKPSPVATTPASPGPLPTSAVRSLHPTASATPSPTEAARPSQSAKPPAATLTSIQCEPATLPVGEQAECTITLSAAAAVDTTVTLTASSADVQMPAATLVPKGQKTKSFAVVAANSSGSPTTITAKLGQVTVTAAVTVMPVVPTVSP